jgi:hypothetical protein
MAKAGRKPAMTAVEKKNLKAEMVPLLKSLATLRTEREALAGKEALVASEIHKRIGGVSFRFDGEILQAIKRTDKADDGTIVSERYFVRSLGEKRTLDF